MLLYLPISTQVIFCFGIIPFISLIESLGTVFLLSFWNRHTHWIALSCKVNLTPSAFNTILVDVNRRMKITQQLHIIIVDSCSCYMAYFCMFPFLVFFHKFNSSFCISSCQIDLCRPNHNIHRIFKTSNMCHNVFYIRTIYCHTFTLSLEWLKYSIRSYQLTNCSSGDFWRFEVLFEHC